MKKKRGVGTTMVCYNSHVKRARWACTCLAVVLLFCPTARADEVEVCADSAELAAKQRSLGHLRKALRHFERCAKDTCPQVVREYCRKGIAETRDTAPRIHVRAREESGRDLPDARITIDEEDVAGEELSRGALVDPGRHVLRASSPGFTDAEQTIIVTAADHARTVDLALRTVSAKTEGAPQSPDRRAAIVTGSVGLALVLGFGVVGTWTYIDYRRLERQCGSLCEHADVQAVRTRGVVADVLLGAGLGTLAVAAVLWVTAGQKTEPPNAALLTW